MSTTWKSYLPQVLPHVRGCPTSLAINAVRDAAIELCSKSRIWRSTLTAQNIVADQDEYTLSPPSNTTVITPVYVEVDEIVIRPMAADTLDHIAPRWRIGGALKAYHMLDATTLKLSWTPDEAVTDGLVVMVSLKPTEDSTQGDDILYDDWKRGIAAGAIGALKMMSDERWSDAVGAEKFRETFLFESANAKARARKSRTYRGTQVKMRPAAIGSGGRR